MQQTRSLARSPLALRAGHALGALSAVALVIMMSVTFIGVVMRYAFNAPILGVNEMMELSSVALVMLAMPYATQAQVHVRVDVLDKAIGKYARYFGDLMTRAVSSYVLFVLVQRAWLRFTAALQYGDATNMLKAPLWPFYGLIVLGMSLFILVLLLQAVDIARKGPTDHD